MTLIASPELDHLARDSDAAAHPPLGIAAAVVVGHVLGLIALVTLDLLTFMPHPPDPAEIPVEIVSSSDAPQGQSGTKPPEPQQDKPLESAKENTAQPQDAPQPAPPAANAKAEAQLTEPPKPTDAPQANNKQAAKATDPKANSAAFGALDRGRASAPEQDKQATTRLPVFADPKAFLEAGGAAPKTEDENDAYRAKIFGMIGAAKIFPESAKARQARGLTVVGFALNDDGTLVNVWIVRSSGHADLDAATLDMVHRAAPFPPPPPKSDRNFAAGIEFGQD